MNEPPLMFSPRRVFVGGFFVVLLLAGIIAHRGYGIGWDEKTQYMIGSQAYDFLTKGTPWTSFADWKYYGTTFELILTFIEHLFDLTSDARATMLMRHFVTFLSFYGGVVCFYFLCKKLVKDWRWALLGCLLLVLEPRIFAQSFYNSKDIPPVAMFTVTMYTLLRLTERQTVLRLVIHAFACAVLVTIRMTGMLLLPFTMVFLGRALLLDSGMGNWRDALRRFALWAGAFILFWWGLTVLLWPYLWDHPVLHFLDAYRDMSTKQFGGVYFGQKISIPVWHWIPVWIAITTPLTYTALFLFGAGRRLLQIVLHPVRTFLQQEIPLLVLGWFFLPMLIIIIIKAGIISDWRHVFFLYPAFVLLAVDGAQCLFDFSQRKFRSHIPKILLLGSLAISCSSTIVWMIRNHPVQSVYFSLPARLIDGNFELDYWGLSFRPGIEWVLANDPSPYLLVYFTGSSGYGVQNLLTTEQRARYMAVDQPEYAEYILDNFYGHDYKRDRFLESWKVHSIYAGSIEVLAIYKNPYYNPEIIKYLPRWPDHGFLFFF